MAKLISPRAGSPVRSVSPARKPPAALATSLSSIPPTIWGASIIEKEKAARLIQKQWHRYWFRKCRRFVARRLFSIREIVSTERTYADSLQLLHRSFVEQAPISDEEKKQLFAPMDPLREWHVGFALKLEIALKSKQETPEKAIGTAFRRLIELQMAYRAYASHYPRLLKSLEGLKASMGPFLAQCEEHTLKNTVVAFCILPVQRPPRYLLLLREVLKYTPVVHSDYKSLKNALTTARMICDVMNMNEANFEQAVSIARPISPRPNGRPEPATVNGPLSPRGNAGAALSSIVGRSESPTRSASSGWISARVVPSSGGIAVTTAPAQSNSDRTGMTSAVSPRTRGENDEVRSSRADALAKLQPLTLNLLPTPAVPPPARPFSTELYNPVPQLRETSSRPMSVASSNPSSIPLPNPSPISPRAKNEVPSSALRSASPQPMRAIVPTTVSPSLGGPYASSYAPITGAASTSPLSRSLNNMHAQPQPVLKSPQSILTRSMASQTPSRPSSLGIAAAALPPPPMPPGAVTPPSASTPPTRITSDILSMLQNSKAAQTNTSSPVLQRPTVLSSLPAMDFFPPLEEPASPKMQDSPRGKHVPPPAIPLADRSNTAGSSSPRSPRLLPSPASTTAVRPASPRALPASPGRSTSPSLGVAGPAALSMAIASLQSVAATTPALVRPLSPARSGSPVRMPLRPVPAPASPRGASPARGGSPVRAVELRPVPASPRFASPARGSSPVRAVPLRPVAARDAPPAQARPGSPARTVSPTRTVSPARAAPSPFRLPVARELPPTPAPSVSPPRSASPRPLPKIPGTLGATTAPSSPVAGLRPLPAPPGLPAPGYVVRTVAQLQLMADEKVAPPPVRSTSPQRLSPRGGRDQN